MSATCLAVSVSVTVLCAFSVNVCVCVKCVCVSTECASRVCVASACESSLSVPSLCACVRQFVHACVSTGVRACRMVNAVSRVTVVSVYAVSSLIRNGSGRSAVSVRPDQSRCR